jgi:Cu/Ag efflux pump CusA
MIAGGLFLGGEFMPQLEEGNLWVRATLPQDASYETGARMARNIRTVFLAYPEVTQVVSQMGRPDDGTDVTTFNNIEFLVTLKGTGDWPRGTSKEKLVDQMNTQLERFPGIDFNFSQNIQDNVEEAMSGVKGENSIKLFGDDIDVLVAQAGTISDIMAKVPGITDLGVFQETGQPEFADFDQPQRKRTVRADGVRCGCGSAGRDWGQRCHADSRRGPALRFYSALRTAVSFEPGGDTQHPPSHAGWE